MDFKLLGKTYRGQAYNISGEYPGRDAIYYDLNQFNKNLKPIIQFIIDKLNIQGIYLHQGDALKKYIEDERDLAIGIEKGNGKDFFCFLTTVINTSSGYKTIYFVSEKRFIDKKLDKFETYNDKIGKILNIKGAVDEKSFGSYINVYSPDLLITTPEILYRYLVDSKEDPKKDYFTFKLGQIILSEFFDFEMRDFIHIKYLFSFMRSLSTHKIRFILTTYFAGELKNISSFLTSKSPEEIETVTMEASPKNPFNLIFGMPEINLQKKNGELFAVRKGYNEEVISLVSSLVSKLNKKNLLIWHAFSPISSQGIQLINEKIVEEISEKELGFSLYVISDPKEMPENLSSKFDSVIILGLPRNLRRIKNLIGNFIEKSSECIVIMPEDPFSHYYSRLEERHIFDDMLPLAFSPSIPSNESNNFVKINYFKLFLVYTPMLYHEIKDIKNIWGDIDLNLYLDNSVSTDDALLRIIKQEDLIESLIPLKWGGISEDDLYFYYNETPYFVIEPEKYPLNYFPGSVIYSKGEKYIVKNINKDKKRGDLELVSINDPVKTIPIIKFVKINFSEKDSKRLKNSSLEITESVGHIDCLFKLTGYKEYYDYNLSGSSPSFIEINPKISNTIKSDALKISSIASHEIEHILKIFIPVFFPQIYKHLFIFYYGQDVYLIPTASYFSSVVYTLYNEINQILKDEFLFSFIKSCPCISGCPLCLKILDCVEENSLDKAKLLQNLSKDGKDYEFLLKGLKCRDAQPEYEKIRNRILELFKNHLGIAIKSPVNIFCVNDLGKNVLGIFDNKKVKVIEKLTMRDAIEVIAHEYAHNYQKEGNLFSEKKIILEGFAEWVAFKILSFYGLIENMKKMKLREYDCYGQGFNLLYWLEQKIGFYGVIDFIKNGKAVSLETNKEYDLNRIIKESGITLVR